MIIGDKRPRRSKSDDAMDKMDLFVAGKVGCFEAKMNRNVYVVCSAKQVVKR